MRPHFTVATTGRILFNWTLTHIRGSSWSAKSSPILSLPHNRVLENTDRPHEVIGFRCYRRGEFDEIS